MSEKFGMAGTGKFLPACGKDVLQYQWPGNVRELRNAAQQFVLGLGH